MEAGVLARVAGSADLFNFDEKCISITINSN
jgi:hypothetical protein